MIFTKRKRSYILESIIIGIALILLGLIMAASLYFYQPSKIVNVGCCCCCGKPGDWDER
jgi:hypothetical protein